jgi:hypothetical protein
MLKTSKNILAFRIAFASIAGLAISSTPARGQEISAMQPMAHNVDKASCDLTIDGSKVDPALGQRMPDQLIMDVVGQSLADEFGKAENAACANKGGKLILRIHNNTYPIGYYAPPKTYFVVQNSFRQAFVSLEL